MKILVANIGSTSLKWRLFDFSNGPERLLHKGGFERVTDYPKAIEDCLARTEEVRRDPKRKRSGGGRIQNRPGQRRHRLCAPRRTRARGDGRLTTASRRRTIRPTSLASGCSRNACPACRWSGCSRPPSISGRPRPAMRYAVPEAWHRRRRPALGFPWREPQVHRRTLGGTARPRRRRRTRAQNLYVDGGKTPVNAPDLRVISCHLGGSSSVTGILQRRGHRQQHGHEPAIRSAAEQPRRRSRFGRVPLRGADARHHAWKKRSASSAKESGLKGISGVSNDIRDIASRSRSREMRAPNSRSMFSFASARHWIGGYFWRN